MIDNDRSNTKPGRFNPRARLDTSRVSDRPRAAQGPATIGTTPTYSVKGVASRVSQSNPSNPSAFFRGDSDSDSNPVPYVVRQRQTIRRTPSVISRSAPVGAASRRSRPTKDYGFGLGLKGLVLPIPEDDMQFTDAGDFGPRVHPSHGRYSNHTGIDMSNPQGTPIRAVAGGFVVTAGWDNIYGNQIILDHGQQQQSMYGHTAQMLVEPGQRVKRGQVIGYVGSTGLSTGPHLHFETWEDGTPVDPFKYLREGNMLSDLSKAIDAETRTRMMNRRRAAKAMMNGPNGDVVQQYGNKTLLPTPSGQRPAVSQQPNPSMAPQPSAPRVNPQLQGFLRAISAQESGNDYGAVGTPTKYGTAYGKYQILDQNFVNPGGWDLEALDRDITLEQYMRTPEFQERMARAKLTEYFRQFGAEGAAKAWYAGPGNAMTNSDAPQYGGPSINDYAAQVLARMLGTG